MGSKSHKRLGGGTETGAWRGAAWRRGRHLEHGQLLPLLLYGEGGVRVEDDGGARGLRVELPLLGDARRLGAWSEAQGQGEPTGSGSGSVELDNA